VCVCVCVCVCLSVSLLDTSVSPAKTDEPIEMPFGLDQGTMYWGRGRITQGRGNLVVLRPTETH